jgi:hypothetical protein
MPVPRRWKSSRRFDLPHRPQRFIVVTLDNRSAVNGTVSKVILASGINAEQLTEVRCAGAVRTVPGSPRRPSRRITYAAYILLAERAVPRRDPISLSAWSFLFATIFWSVLAPWWDFPAGRVDDSASLLGNLACSQRPMWALIL